ncbi:MAG: 30S ribosomal protein S4 [Patescibacteria group bacterium]
MRVANTCKACRRLGVSVCGRQKCALTRKPYPPGINGKKFRRGGSEFGLQLRDKQKIRLTYGLREKQFKNLVLQAFKQKSVGTTEAIVLSLESRLDNVAYRFGFATTRGAARQMVGHGHITVNGRRVTIPSYRVKVGDSIGIRLQSVGRGIFNNLDFTVKKNILPSWLSWDHDKKTGRIVAYPTSDVLKELGKGFNINAIVEFYSR